MARWPRSRVREGRGGGVQPRPGAFGARRGLLITLQILYFLTHGPGPYWGVFFSPHSRFFFLIFAKLREPTTRNLQYLSAHQLYTICANTNFVPTIGWPQMTPEWCHVQAILMQNKGLQESLSWTQFISLNYFFLMKWRRIDRPTELLYLSDFQQFETKKKLFDKLSKIFFCRKKGYMLWNWSRWNNFESFSLIYKKMANLYISFLCIRVKDTIGWCL